MYPERRRQILTFSLTAQQKGRGGRAGFTLLELIIVMLLISLMLGMSTVFFANMLPSSRFNATVRDMASTIRHSRNLSQINGRKETFIVDLDLKKYGIEGRGEKIIPSDINLKVVDPLYGETRNGRHRFVFNVVGGLEGGTVVLWNKKKTAAISIDPVAGAVVIK